MPAVSSNSDSNLFAALAYLPIAQPIIPIITYLLKPNDQFVKFHSLQSIAYSIAFIVLWFALIFVSMVIWLATFGIGLFIMLPIVFLVFFAFFAVDIYLMYKAYKGEKYKLPTIGDWAESYK